MMKKKFVCRQLSRYICTRKIQFLLFGKTICFKLTHLLSVNNILSEMCSFGKYIRDAFQLRSNLLTWYIMQYFCEIYW